MLYIKKASIYTPHKIIKNGHILIEGSKIARVSTSPVHRLPSSTETIDAKGKLLCPGFIDVHIQGAGGYDILDGREEALEGISQTIAKFGTTSFLATTVFKNGSNDHIKALTTYNLRLTTSIGGARLLGIHLEGPFVNKGKKGMIRPDGITGCSLNQLNKILDITKGKLKMMTIAPELSAKGGSAMNSVRSGLGGKGALEIIKRLKKEGVIVSFGHSEASYEETKKGIAAGISHVTHIFNAMRPIHHREPGPMAALLMDDNVSVQLICDGIHIHPAIIKLIVKLKGIKNIVLITDSMSSQGQPDGKYVYDGWEYESKDGVCRYKDGTLIGTSLPLNKMIKRMVQFGGVSLLEAIQMATINPARALGIDGKKGSVEESKDADLVVMDKNLEVVMTLIGGKIVYKGG